MTHPRSAASSIRPVAAVEQPLFAARRWWNTVRWLRPRQLYGRVWFRTYHPRPDLRPAATPRFATSAWVAPVLGAPCLAAPGAAVLLGETRDISAARAWDAAEVPKLWRYHLHYFDDLNARDASDREGWHQALIQRWIVENPPGRGTGWEPYPVSRRIVNWVKWALAGGSLSKAARDSLAVQTRWLDKRIEWHLLGNHLWSNAKALIIAGSFFSGREADAWRERGARILREQLAEQVLPDGGHFELSPMYHALALEDVLDLVNTSRAWPGRVPEALIAALGSVCPAMLHWLVCLRHPDGGIALFNDSAFEVAPTPSELLAYASRLGFAPVRPAESLEHLTASGYVRVERGPFLLLCDVGKIGPDYLPGHAHADSLSFELSLGGERWVVDSGCSTYARGPERLRQRGTAAHNTVVVDGRDSSQVWSSFRVARRARPRDVHVRTEAQAVFLEAAHDGYLEAGGPLHQRRIRVDPSSLEIEDSLRGPFSHAEARLHLHPEVTVTAGRPGELQLRRGSRSLALHAEGAELSLAAGSWHPSFNQSQPNQVVVARLTGPVVRCRFEVR
jgi:uncharacterized heparinase superfamily protein